MPLSAFLTTILEQAKEQRLYCLRGAGYFTSKEWAQLDLIMNKEYIGTTVPTSFHLPGVITSLELEHETSSLLSDGRMNDTSSSDVVASPCNSTEPTISDFHVSPASISSEWKYPLSLPSSNYFESFLPSPKESRIFKNLGQQATAAKTSCAGSPHAEEFKDLHEFLEDKGSGTSKNPGVGSDSKSNNSLALNLENISAWTSEVHSNLSQQPPNHRSTLKTSSNFSQPEKKEARSPKFTNNEFLKTCQGDVNLFETNNAAEWDEASQNTNKSSSNRYDIPTTVSQEMFCKTAKNIAQERYRKAYSHPVLSAPHKAVVARDLSRVLDMPRLTRQKESKDRRAAKENDTVISQQKTRVCWFWAESPGGCRYRPDECLNLHARPKPLAINGQYLGNLSSMHGGANNYYEGSLLVKPLTCWSWATTGNCGKGDKCKDVHGWVVGGVAPAPEDVGPVKMSNSLLINKRDIISGAAVATTATATISNERKEDMLNSNLVDLETND